MGWLNSTRLKHEVREWAEAIVVAVILTVIIRAFIVQAFVIPSGSMLPTLQIGDRLFVSKFIYRFREPERWEIVVFKYPEDLKKDFIKRMIAVGGERVEIRDGSIYVNGEKQDPPDEIAENMYYNEGAFGGVGQVIEVPENSYYVLGDNSGSSRDSRYWGFVPKKNMVGKAFVRWWPAHRIGRLDRIFQNEHEPA